MQKLTTIDSWALGAIFKDFSLLLTGSLAALELPPSKNTKDLAFATSLRETNLRHLAQLWEATTAISKISANELEANRSEWKDFLGVLDDALDEVDTFIKGGIRPDFATQSDDGSDAENDAPDGLSETLTTRELDVMRSTHMVLRLGRLVLHRLVNSSSPAITSTSSSSKPAPYTSNAFFTKARDTLDDLTAQSDDLASSLSDFPHNAESISELLEEYLEVVESVSHLIEAESSPIVNSSLDALATLSLTGTTVEPSSDTVTVTGKIEESETSWQEMFRDQLRKAAKKATAALHTV